MAKATGFACDRKECGKFEVGEALPLGWITLGVQVSASSGSGVSRNTFELCSNYCAAILLADRADADGTPVNRKARAGNRFTPEGLAAAQRNGRRSGHVRAHTNKGVVDPDCEFCQEITDPALVPA